MRSHINRPVALIAPVLLAGCVAAGSGLKPAPAIADNGPADDYPVVLGDPFTIDGITYTPEDVMNFDAVGHAVVDAATGRGVVGAHKTLPFPSYVEVTSLETGRTILVRIVSRGPMRSDALIALSPDAAMQLGAGAEAKSAVRVRRVNPPEVERAALRAGEPVPPRMDTPAPLLAALKRKLASEAGGEPVTVPPRPEMPGPVKVDPDLAAAPSPPVSPAKLEAAVPAPVTPPKPVADTPAPDAPARTGTFVQIGAFSVEANARKAADQVSATVSKSGRLWLVRMGPFASKAETEAALAEARAAGYGDAMVKRID